MEYNTGRYASGLRLTSREELVLVEIGLDKIDTASSFVEYMSESYMFSRSSVWYILKRLKDKGALDFATKDDPGKALELTSLGKAQMRSISSGRNKLIEHFTSAYVINVSGKTHSSQGVG
jgi:predicted transcriptional regulator